MQFAHDLDADALYITLAAGTIARTVEIEDGTMADIDADGRLVGIEVISPRRPWPLAEIAQRFDLAGDDAAMLKAMDAAPAVAFWV